MSSDYSKGNSGLEFNVNNENLPSKADDVYSLASLPKKLINWIEQHSYDLIIICDMYGEIMFVSHSVNKLLGYEPCELVGKKALNYLPIDDQQKILQKNIGNTNLPQKFNINLRDCFGKYVWVETVISKDFLQSDVPVYISLSKDITDKKEAEEMLIRSEKMSVAGQLAAGVAHEIRNPLTSLKGFVQLLQAGIDRKEEYYKIMVDEIDKIDTITSELLFISKPMTDERKYENVSKMLRDVVTLLQSQANLHNINIRVEMDNVDTEVYCDRTQIKQVLINLIKNAVEEMLDGGTITVEVSYSTTTCSISIIDEGPGIPEHILHKLKEPFFTTKKNGTGLGLMISNKIIENHQGTLDIFQNKEKGSTFTIKLPISPEI
ncbi:ATP-binding protein [Aquibacillus kalidii]|uniref:ATP-binding protein n=1 Tax=Aquibacillus kalidii TaxID=2762597 RepID=UPI001644E87B|nr:ATP-binding protein [Aquibacillus kalidii]